MLDSLLDNIYGAWFMPERTFRALREQPVLWQAFVVVALLNGLDAIRRSGASLPGMILAVLMGILGWVTLTALLQLLAFCFGRSAPSFAALLCLTGFAGLPWLLLGPAQSLGGVAGSLLGLAALLWFVVWQVRAAAVALDLEWWRLLVLIPLTFLGGILALSWLTNGIVVLASLS